MVRVLGEFWNLMFIKELKESSVFMVVVFPILSILIKLRYDELRKFRWLCKSAMLELNTLRKHIKKFTDKYVSVRRNPKEDYINEDDNLYYMLHSLDTYYKAFESSVGMIRKNIPTKNFTAGFIRSKILNKYRNYIELEYSIADTWLGHIDDIMCRDGISDKSVLKVRDLCYVDGTYDSLKDLMLDLDKYSKKIKTIYILCISWMIIL